MPIPSGLPDGRPTPGQRSPRNALEREAPICLRERVEFRAHMRKTPPRLVSAQASSTPHGLQAGLCLLVEPGGRAM